MATRFRPDQNTDAKSRAKKGSNFAAYLDKIIGASGKTNLEISEDMGYSGPTMISMVRNGRGHLPLMKAEQFAKAVHVDPAFLMRKLIEEYYPEVGSVVFKHFGGMVTEQESALLNVAREANPEGHHVSAKALTEIKKIIAAEAKLERAPAPTLKAARG